MKQLNGSRMRLMIVGFTVVIIFGGGRANADFTFGEPVNLGLPINTSSNEVTFCLSADGLEMYMSSNRPGTYDGLGDIWVSTRPTINDNWTEPVNLGPVVNSPFQDTVEYISPDGLELYFDSLNRPGGRGGWDIWMTKRATMNDPWSTPVNMGTPFNTSGHDWGACITPDNLKFYFTSMRPDGYGSEDIWIATRATPEDAWAELVNMGPIVNSSSHECGQNITAAGLTFFFSSKRPGGYGSHDLWVTTRRTTDGDWDEPVNLGPTINTSYEDMEPEIFSDGSTLYFSSTRPGGRGAWDIYQVSIIPIVDFNGDGCVDIDDLVILIENWKTSESLCDIGPMPWGDGVVNIEDLKVFMSYWGQEFDDPTLIAHWKLDETEGAVANDSAGEIQAELYGDPIWRPADGMIDGALMLDGIDDFVGTWNIPGLSAGQLSVFAWIKGGAASQVVLSQFRGVNWLMADASDGYLKTDLKEAGETAQSLVSDVTITDGNWHRVGITWDGTNRVLYVDDAAVASDTQTSLERSNMGLNIGCGPDEISGTFFWGLIDDVRIYNRAVKP